MDFFALGQCLTTSSCFVTQTAAGLIGGLLLFLVAAGLSLIFGVLRVVNFAHGTFYMLGAYIGFTVANLTGSYLLAVLAGTASMALCGIAFERGFLSRLYGSDVMMQLLICYAIVLIADDVVKFAWGPDFQTMGMPEAFQTPPFFFAGGVIPPFYLMLGSVALAIALLLSVALDRSRVGKIVRAAATNPTMVSVLGVNTVMLYATVMGLGAGLAGLAGALAAPVRSLTPGMGFSILIESFVVTVIGGMGSIVGALVAALFIGLLRSFGTVGFPMLTEQLIYASMMLVLIVKPSGLLGKEVA